MRKIVFWSHLVCGIVTGIFIALMSLTGVIIAFEQEVIAYIDRDVSRLEKVDQASEVLKIDHLLSRVEQAFPGFGPASFQYFPDERKAWIVQNRKRETLYVNPFSGKIKEPLSNSAHDFFHFVEDLHRFLGFEGDLKQVGKFVNGVANLILLFLCVSGLYLWFPVKWIWRLFKKNLLLNKRARGSARDLNRHNVYGFWSLSVLTVLAATAAVFSFDWAHRLVFQMAGEQPPAFRDFRMMMVAPPEIEDDQGNRSIVSYEEALASVMLAFPGCDSVVMRLNEFVQKDAVHSPLNIAVYQPALFRTMGYTPAFLDPHSGEILKSVSWKERSKGLRARVWVRFLHTGEAFGWIGKTVAAAASLASLMLVYTGFVMSIGRWKRYSLKRTQKSPEK